MGEHMWKKMARWRTIRMYNDKACIERERDASACMRRDQASALAPV